MVSCQCLKLATRLQCNIRFVLGIILTLLAAQILIAVLTKRKAELAIFGHTETEVCLQLRDISSLDGKTVAELAAIDDRVPQSLVECADGRGVLKRIEKCWNIKPLLVSAQQQQQHNNQSSSGCFAVPDIVHYTILRKVDNKHKPQPLDEFRFLHYLSFLGAWRHLQPAYILIHGDQLPHGQWWSRVVTDIPNVYFVNVPLSLAPTHIHNRSFHHVELRTDFLRKRATYEFGGIYLDPDILVFKSFNPLRNYSLTLGQESPKPRPHLNNGVIISRPGAAFTRIWLETYHTFQTGEWSHHSVVLTGILSEVYTHLIHVEDKTLINPYWGNFAPLFNANHTYNWTQQYSCHVWHRGNAVPGSPEGIKRLNSTLGQMMRYIYFGSRDMV